MILRDLILFRSILFYLVKYIGEFFWIESVVKTSLKCFITVKNFVSLQGQNGQPGGNGFIGDIGPKVRNVGARFFHLL